MIIVKLIGGLGNQMFQYAFARSLALHHGVELKLDISELSMSKEIMDFTNRPLGLYAFSIVSEIASDEEVRSFLKGKGGKIIDRVSLSLPFKSRHFYLREPYFQFYSKAMKAPAHTYVDGYWHSEKYFVVHRKQIVNDFTIKNISSPVEKWKDEIENKNAVSVHVRRGDYLNETNRKIYAECGSAYYLKAMEAIGKKTADAEYYIFSDDPDWCMKNLGTGSRLHFVDVEKQHKPHEDIFLMSLCKHNVIANSSFSWWGAWLNRNKNKIVIAPEKWFLSADKNTKDLLPENWIKI
ncbi:MAG: alpha-1,2-fucosyltransferase [Bacteroidota bacterium]